MVMTCTCVMRYAWYKMLCGPTGIHSLVYCATILGLRSKRRILFCSLGSESIVWSMFWSKTRTLKKEHFAKEFTVNFPQFLALIFGPRNSQKSLKFLRYFLSFIDVTRRFLVQKNCLKITIFQKWVFWVTGKRNKIIKTIKIKHLYYFILFYM